MHANGANKTERFDDNVRRQIPEHIVKRIENALVRANQQLQSNLSMMLSGNRCTVAIERHGKVLGGPFSHGASALAWIEGLVSGYNLGTRETTPKNEIAVYCTGHLWQAYRRSPYKRAWDRIEHKDLPAFKKATVAEVLMELYPEGFACTIMHTCPAGQVTQEVPADQHFPREEDL